MLRYARAPDRIAIDTTMPISLRFSNYSVIGFMRGAEPFETPPKPMRIPFRMGPNPQLRHAASNLMGPKQVRGDLQ